MKEFTIEDCMSSDFAKINASMPVAEASAKLIAKEVLGAPVLDEAGKLCGWISEQECLKVTIQVVFYEQRIATVADVMRREVLVVRLSDSPMDLAQQMLGNKPKIYPVVDGDNKVIGVVSRRSLLRMLDGVLQERAKELSLH